MSGALKHSPCLPEALGWNGHAGVWWPPRGPPNECLRLSLSVSKPDSQGPVHPEAQPGSCRFSVLGSSTGQQGAGVRSELRVVRVGCRSLRTGSFLYQGAQKRWQRGQSLALTLPPSLDPGIMSSPRSFSPSGKASSCATCWGGGGHWVPAAPWRGSSVSPTQATAGWSGILTDGLAELQGAEAGTEGSLALVCRLPAFHPPQWPVLPPPGPPGPRDRERLVSGLSPSLEGSQSGL